MYLATKDGSSCRIPERKAAYYKSMGYSLESLEPEVRTGHIFSERKEDRQKRFSYAGGRKPGE